MKLAAHHGKRLEALLPAISDNLMGWVIYCVC